MARKRKAPRIADDGWEPAEVIHLDEPAGNGGESKNILFASSALERDLKLPAKRGRRQGYPWGKTRAEIIRRLVNNWRPERPVNESKLAGDIARWCEDQREKPPSDSELRAMIAAVVKVLQVLLS